MSLPNKPGRRPKPKVSMTAVPVKDPSPEQVERAEYAYGLLVKSIYRRLQHASTTDRIVRTVDGERPA